MISLYWTREAVELQKKCLDAIERAAQNQIPVLLGGDLNAHLKLWGSTKDTARGFQVEKLLFDDLLACTNTRYLL